MGGTSNVSSHPTPATLGSFLLGKLAGAERRAVVTHLLRGCPSCQEAIAPFAHILLHPEADEAADDSWRYDFAFRRAMRQVFSGAIHAPAGVPAPRAAASLLAMPSRPGWDRDVEQFRRCERALDETRRLGKSNPQEMLALACANAILAERLDPAAFPPGAVYDLQAKAFAELGNSRRILNDLVGAEAGFERALRRAKLGSGDRRLFAEIISMAASVYRAGRRFDRAFSLLDRACEVYLALGEEHFAGRTLISMGTAKGAYGDTAESIGLLREGLRLLDRKRDPELLLIGVHNLIAFQVIEGRFAEGRDLIRAHADLYRQRATVFVRLRLRWVEGQIAAGLGEAAEAEVAFLEARDGFAEHRLAYVEALISLDLAALWLAQGRTAEIGSLLAEVLGTFRALGIRREAIAVLLMLEEAANAERLTVALVGSAAASLRKLEAESGG
jgi:tetratricopeptide (TPR) repeat protein